MPIIVLFGQLGGRTVRRAPDLRAQLEFFTGRPTMAEFSDFQMQTAEFLVDDQILQFPILAHLF
jgi:hypothetical protein